MILPSRIVFVSLIFTAVVPGRVSIYFQLLSFHGAPWNNVFGILCECETAVLRCFSHLLFGLFARCNHGHSSLHSPKSIPFFSAFSMQNELILVPPQILISILPQNPILHSVILSPYIFWHLIPYCTCDGSIIICTMIFFCYFLLRQKNIDPENLTNNSY